MIRRLALLWLVVVLLAAGHVGWRAWEGLHFVADLMALLPAREQDEAADRARRGVADGLVRQLLVLPGHADPGIARDAARTIGVALTATGMVEMEPPDIDPDGVRRIASFYAPYRAGLLADRDRLLLQAERADQVATRALSQVFGVLGLGDAALLRRDPFLLLPSFLAALPLPGGGLTVEDGWLQAQRDGRTFVLLTARLTRNPHDLDVQSVVVGALDQALERLRARHPDLEAPRLGAIFFAEAAASEAMRETSMIGLASVAGTALIILFVFRGLTPLWLSLLVIGTGVLTALSACLMLFGDVHVGAMLFGVSLIGVAVDYSLQYCTEALVPGTTPTQRLRPILAGITLGMVTTVIGYLTLLLAPFPGLRQVAVFSAVGLVAAWMTTVLWLPILDRRADPANRSGGAGRQVGVRATRLLMPWARPGRHWLGGTLLLVLIGAAALGMTRLHRDDDIRRMQALSPDLLQQQERVRTLIGFDADRRFFVVEAPDSETALRREEALADRLGRLIASGALENFRGPARFVPSMHRQRETHALVTRVLDAPRRDSQFRRLGLRPDPADQAGDAPSDTPILTLAAAIHPDSPLRFLHRLVLDRGPDQVRHLVMLEGIKDQAAIAIAGQGLDGVHLVDPAGSFSETLARYRDQALVLLGLSAFLIAAPLLWRYGPRRAARVIAPPVLAVLLTPGLRAWSGDGFSFFDSIALVLILAMGVDYAVFMAETTRARVGLTALAILLAAGTTLLSFGLLALSGVRAVHQFGATMLVGITLAAALSPIARYGASRRSIPWGPLGVLPVLLLHGCADAPPHAETRVAIAPDLTLTLPAPDSLGPDSLGLRLEAIQLVVARHDGRSLAFEGRISITPDRIAITCVDGMGRRLMDITWTRTAIIARRSAEVPPHLAPENILADLVLLYWPEPVVRQALSGGTLTVNAGARIVAMDGTQAIHAEHRPGPAGDPWSGSSRLQNVAWGYSLDIQSRIIDR